MKKNPKKLTLSKETITSLEAGEVINVAGGLGPTQDRLQATCWMCPDTK